MSKIRYTIIIILFICGGITACKKSDQDFKYTKLNELTISGESSISVTQFDTLKIDPAITQSKPAGETFTYQWKIYPNSSTEGIPTQILATTKALNTVMALPPLSYGYSLEYKVTNTANGVSTFKMFNISVLSVFRDGWLVSSSADGKAHLGFIRSDYRVFYDPAESVNQTTYLGNAVGTYVYRLPGGSGLGINHFTDKGNYRFDASNFLLKGQSIGSFNPLKNKFDYAQSNFGTEEYVINDGSLYAASLVDNTSNITYTDRIYGDYKMYPKVIPSTTFTTFFYDNKNQRFMTISFGGFTLTPMLGSSASAFDLGNTGMTMVGAMDGAASTGTQDFYFVMQDVNGNRYLYSLSGATPVLNQQILNSPQITTAKSFSVSLVLRQMYYATDNNIYLYDILANSSQLLYTFPSGVTIKQINVQPTDSQTLVVAANSGSIGKVYFFNLDTQGKIANGTYAKKIEGFGEISNINYRKLN